MKNSTHFVFTAVLVVFGLFWWPGTVTGQSQTAQSQKHAASAATTPGQHMTAQEIRGEGLFLQRCSLCHLDKTVKPYKSFGPSLTGRLKGASPAKEKGFRLLISSGVPDKMPGFQYALNPDEFDDLIAYLKTL